MTPQPTKLSKAGRERLEKLATHLESGKLGHEVFDYLELNDSEDHKFDSRGCGTAGCALGELPIVFPDQWHFCKISDRRFEPRTLDSSMASEPFNDAAKFFGLDRDSTSYLFIPDQLHPDYDRDEDSPDEDATKEEVAAHIRRFLASTEAE